MYNDEMQNKDDGNAIMTPLAARLWNRGATYAWADVDIKETPNEYVFSFDIPEPLRNNIKIWISDNRLFVSGNLSKAEGSGEKSGFKGRKSIMEPEKENRRYYRSFCLPQAVDGDKLFAQFVDGDLIVFIPKSIKAKFNNINLN